MSQYIAMQEKKKFVYGWDPPLQTFFLQVHDLTQPEDEQIVMWLGVDAKTTLYEVEDLVKAANKEGLDLGLTMSTILYTDKDEGR